MSTVQHLASRHIHATRSDKLCILVQQWCQHTLYISQLNINTPNF